MKQNETTEGITRRKLGYHKSVAPEDAIKLIKELRQQLSFLEKGIIQEDKSWVNISREITIQQNVYNGKINSLSIYFKCWCIGSLYWKEFPDFRINNNNFKIEWYHSEIRVLWSGKF